MSAVAVAHETPPNSRVAGYAYVFGSNYGVRYRTAKCRTYVGCTDDLDACLALFNASKGVKITRNRSWVLLYAEPYPTIAEALIRMQNLRRDRGFRLELAFPLSVDPAPPIAEKRSSKLKPSAEPANVTGLRVQFASGDGHAAE